MLCCKEKLCIRTCEFCTGNVSVSQSLVSDVGNEADLQFQPIILSESDILSFNVSQTELNLSNTDEVTIFTLDQI